MPKSHRRIEFRIHIKSWIQCLKNLKNLMNEVIWFLMEKIIHLALDWNWIDIWHWIVEVMKLISIWSWDWLKRLFFSYAKCWCLLFRFAVVCCWFLLLLVVEVAVAVVVVVVVAVVLVVIVVIVVVVVVVVVVVSMNISMGIYLTIPNFKWIFALQYDFSKINCMFYTLLYIWMGRMAEIQTTHPYQQSL